MAEDDKQEPKIKVTDRRMFTAEGELREDFQHLERSAAEPAPEPATAAPGPEPKAPEPEPRQPAAAAGAEPGEPLGGERKPEFFDLIATLADPIAIYLGEAKLPDGSSAENLDAARYYIDLLEVLSEKTAGSATAQERAVLQDLLYQFRLRYVRKREG